jgi:hypothetical protein
MLEIGPLVDALGPALEHLPKGSLVALLAIKGVRQAIVRLVSGAVDLPVAYLERLSQGVRDDTAARKQIIPFPVDQLGM